MNGAAAEALHHQQDARHMHTEHGNMKPGAKAYLHPHLHHPRVIEATQHALRRDRVCVARLLSDTTLDVHKSGAVA